MGRKIEIVLQKRGLRFVAELLKDAAPKTCEAVWRALPLGGQTYHAKFANNEFFTLLPPFADPEPGLENPSITPSAGDVMYFYFTPGVARLPDIADYAERVGYVDLAVFYARNNLIFSPTIGPIPGTVFATITENLEGLAAAGDSIWREGFVGERLTFSRLE